MSRLDRGRLPATSCRLARATGSGYRELVVTFRPPRTRSRRTGLSSGSPQKLREEYQACRRGNPRLAAGRYRIAANCGFPAGPPRRHRPGPTPARDVRGRCPDLELTFVSPSHRERESTSSATVSDDLIDRGPVQDQLVIACTSARVSDAPDSLHRRAATARHTDGRRALVMIPLAVLFGRRTGGGLFSAGSRI